MVDAFDIAIRRARLRDRDDALADIGIKDGRITNIAPRLEPPNDLQVSAGT